MLSCDIFTINILYFAKKHFKGSNIEIHQVLTLKNILNLHVSMILANLMNSKWHLGELEK